MMSTPASTAQSMQGYGRGNDTMLMHVTPGEVRGLQALAQRHGGSLTTNPHTGLPEAGFLEDILPMLAGGALTFLTGGAITPLLSAALVGGGTGLATGSLEKGLMAGLGAFGGASLGSAVGAMGAGASNAGTVAATAPELTTASLTGTPVSALPAPANMAALLPGAPNAASLTAPSVASAANTAPAVSLAKPVTASLSGASMPAALPPPVEMATLLPGAPNAAALSTSPPGVLQELLGQQMGDKAATFGREFGEAASGVGPGGKISPMRTGLAALGASAPVLQAMQPTYEPYKKEDDFNYEGPYTPTQRTPRFRGPNANLGDSSEFSYFDNVNPYPGFQPAPKVFAEGGEVARTEDRALRMPTAGYQAGMGAEHNYNFRPVTPAASMTGMPTPVQSGGRQSFAERIASSRNKKNSDDVASAPNMRKYRYDPRTQSVMEDGNYGGAMGEPGGLDDLNIGRFAAGGDVEPKFADKKLDGLAGLFFERAGPPGSGGLVDFLRSLGFNPPNAQGYGPGGLDDGTTKEEYMKRLGMAAQPGGALAPSPQATGPGLAAGGNVNLRDGSFVVDARTVSELGNGSSGAGQELLARHGGQPIRGPGDGVSDSIPASIGGRQRAKVARDEVKFDPEAVQRLGGGDLQRGAKKLYALMEKAQKARKAAGRGQDTKLRKALNK